VNFSDVSHGTDAPLHASARRYDAPAPQSEADAFALASLDVFESAGWAAVHDRARELAGRLADRLRERGRDVAPRGDTTLVAWKSADAPGERAALAERGVALRDIPGRDLLRASVGAWNDEEDLERLLAGLA
jgi:L-cysteine/cystine lyase